MAHFSRRSRRTPQHGSRLQPPSGYTPHRPTTDDLHAVVELIRECEVAGEGYAEMTADDQRGGWERARFSLDEDAWLAVDAAGAVAAYCEIWPREGYTVFVADGYVRPSQREKGLGRWLVRTMEERARELASNAVPGERVIIHNTVDAFNRGATDLLASEGYHVGRTFWRMLIEMTEQLPQRPFPEGVTVRTFREEDAPTVHELIMTAFKDNEGHQYTNYDEWRGFMIDRETFDPAFWWLAEASGEIVAAALCPAQEDNGWVRQFAVRRDHRGTGIGGALLRHVFREHFARGFTKVGLVVDSYNRTGARTVYERAGMHVEAEYQAFEKGNPRRGRLALDPACRCKTPLYTQRRDAWTPTRHS